MESIADSKYLINNNPIPKNIKLLLLDIKEMSDTEILIIYTDEKTGKKYYKLQKNSMIGYLKRAHYDKCNIITDSVDYSFPFTKKEKLYLQTKLRAKMNILKDQQ